MLASNHFTYTGKKWGMEWLTVTSFTLNIKVKTNADSIYTIHNDCEKAVVLSETKLVDWNYNN